ncbi:MAG: hypothetical protein R3C26_02595 [Calditrichia bacterium]
MNNIVWRRGRFQGISRPAVFHTPKFLPQLITVAILRMRGMNFSLWSIGG